MNLTHLRYFVELAHAGNYVVAAERLHTTQPNISYAVNQLERELGVVLMVKNGRSNHLTSYGKQFLNYAEGTLRTLDSGVNAIHRSVQEHTVIRLGFLRYLGSHYIPHLVADYQKEHPDYKIEFEFETGSTASLFESMETNRTDIVFCAPSKTVYGKKSIISNQRFSLIVPPGHPLCKKERVTLADTMEYEYIYYLNGSGIRHILDPFFKKAELKPNIKYEVLEERVVAGFVSAGLGIGIVPHSTLSSRVDVVELNLADGPIGRDIYMVMTDSEDVSPLLTDFFNFAKAHPDSTLG